MFGIYFKDSASLFETFTNKRGNTISLRQQGSHTAMKRNRKITTYTSQCKDSPIDIII
jgi:hypothetical protein